MQKQRETIGRRLLSMFLALALLVTMVQLPGAEWVHAAENTVTLYFELPDGTNASDWCVNAWSSVTVTGDATHKFRPSTWGKADEKNPEYQALIQVENTRWGYVTISGTIEGLQFVNRDGTEEYKCWNAKIAKDGYKEAYFAPSEGKWYADAAKKDEIKEAEVRNIFILAGAVGLTGSSWEIKDVNKLKQDSENANKYSITYKDVAAGTYGYKILQDPENKNWDAPWGYGSGSGGNRSVEVKAPADVTFTIDLKDTEKNVDVTYKYLEKLVVDNGNITAGKETALNTSAKYYDESGNATDVNVSYSLKGSPDGVTLENNKITVEKDAGLTEVIVIVSCDSFQQEMTIPVVDKQYKVTINMYSPDLEMKPNVSDIYIYNNGGEGNAVVDLNKTVTDEDNNVTWVQGTVNVPYNSLGIIARDKAGTWDGGQDKPNRYYVIDENASEVTLWYVYGKTPVTEKPTITKAEPRYLYLEYENPNLKNITPQFYSWTTGFAAELKDFDSADAGKWSIKVPVKSSCTKVDFVVVLDASGSDWIKDGGDHSVAFPEDQTVVCASMKKGEEPQLSAPYNKGYEVKAKEKQIAFYYRDDQALVAGTLADQTVSVDVDGTEYPMTYNADNKRFEYLYSGLKNGNTDYRYKVGDQYVLDKFNQNQEEKDGKNYSYIEYYQLNASIRAEVMKSSFNYNENNVVKFTVDQAASDKKKLEVASASIDVSSLGGSRELAIVPDLQAVTISATRDTTFGTKTLPIVMKDQYGNEYQTSVQVTVTARTKASDKDFDWDEAVIYFMVTDRFFDGNESNNTASGENTYGKNNAGLYHGGDFAGITQKLDYLKNLGINTIWITPIVKNIPGVKVTGTGSTDVPYNAAYHGYWASDFTQLNSTLGTKEEFKTLINEAHKKGIRIMVDIVVNHAGYDTNFEDMIRSGDDIVSGSDQKDSLSNLPDFRTEDPAVSAQLVKWQTQWVKDYGIDYFRVDTVKHVENDTWAELKNALTEVNPDFKMIGEYAGGGYAGNGNTLGTGEMDSDLDFDFNDQAASFVKGNISSVESFLASRNTALNNTYMTGQFLGSHDEDGFKQKLKDGGMSEDAATAASMVAATLQITAKGQPVIYYGEEIGLTGLNNYPYQTNRYDFDWTLVNNDNKTYQHYKKLLSIRNAYTDVFARGNRTSILASDEKGYDVVSRSYGKTTLYVGMNIKSDAQMVSIPVGDRNGSVLTDLYSGKTYTVSGGKVEVSIPSATEGGTVILKKVSGESISGGSSTGGGSSTDTQNPDPSGTVTETKKETIEGTDGKKSEVIIKVEKDTTGKVTHAEVKISTTGTASKNKVTGVISGKVTEYVVKESDSENTEISVTIAAGKKSYTVKTTTKNLTAGKKLKVLAINPKTKKYILVNAQTYTVDKNGDVKLSLNGGASYRLLTEKEAASVEKEILKTVKAEKRSITVKKGKTAKVQLNKKLDMANVSKITYVNSKKSVIKVSKSGKVTAKKPGTVNVKVKVTLNNRKTKTVTVKIKVK